MARNNGFEGPEGLNLISKGTVIEGGISASGSLRIDGKVKGSVRCDETLTLGGTGEIEGEVNVKNATIGGKIVGNLTASEKVVIEARGMVNGDLRAARLIIDEGAIFDGNCNMSKAQSQMKSALKVVETSIHK